MAYSTTVNFQNLTRKLDGLPTNQALGQFMANQAKLGMSPYVPMRTGILDSSAVPTPFHVKYGPLSYARRVWDGKNMKMSRLMHGKASAEWSKPYKAAHIGDLTRATAAYIKQAGLL